MIVEIQMKNGIQSMGRHLLFLFVFLSFILLNDTPAQDIQKIKVACIGNSITEGAGIADKDHYSYPAQLQVMLGSDWVVKNFGVSGRTMLARGDYPYRNEEAFVNAKSFNPDIVIIKLGTNDTKPWNWKFKDDFISDGTTLIREFQNLPSHPRVYICNPVPAFPGAWGIRDSIIKNELLPFIDEIAGKNHTPVINLYTPFIGKSEFFPDRVHPDENGAREIARIIYHTLCTDFHQAEAPSPIPPIPSIRQLAWQDLEYYGFLHFTVNTFTDKEWGYGDEPESIFNPTDFNADHIAATAHLAGMRGLIITAKHHDGFCLWPSNYTEHSVKNSPWRNGKGDVIKELSDACGKYGLKFGVYLSPWDRNNKTYGTPEYITYYRNQLRELLTNYGEISEVWFDGANGGDGYYGGARETRTIDRITYYDWPETWKMVRQLQPNAVIFSDVGPDIRWVGNENGYAAETCWSMYSPKGEQNDAAAPGYTKYQEATEGHRDGTAWLPAECDVSIRPGWFYHESQDTLVKSPEKLFELYLQSIGRNGSLLLNIPPDRRGQFNSNDISALIEFKHIRDSVFSNDYAHTSNVTASNIRGNDNHFSPNKILDDDRNSYWACDDSILTPSLIIDLAKKINAKYILVQEYIPLGQRIESFTIEGFDGRAWQELAKGTTIGHKRILPLAPMMVSKIRLNILRSRACPVIENVEIN
jgi:alpha-L-fucosidase